MDQIPRIVRGLTRTFITSLKGRRGAEKRSDRCGFDDLSAAGTELAIDENPSPGEPLRRGGQRHHERCSRCRLSTGSTWTWRCGGKRWRQLRRAAIAAWCRALHYRATVAPSGATIGLHY